MSLVALSATAPASGAAAAQAAALGSSGAPRQFSAAALRQATPEVQAQEASRQFEAILVRQLLGKTMSSMLGGNEGGTTASVFGDLMTDKFAEQLTAGKGLGLSGMLAKQLSPRAPRAADVAPATTRPSA